MPRDFFLRFCCVSILAGAPLLHAQTGSVILSAAGGGSAIAPGSLATLYGIKLSAEPITGQPDEFGQLPTQLGGYSLEVNGMLAQLQFLGPTQVNFVIPSSAQVGKTNVNLRVSDQVLVQSSVNILPVAPSVFTYVQDGSELGAVVNAVTFQRGLLSPETSAIQGCDKRTRLAIYATGMGFSSNRVRMRDIRVDAQDPAGTVYPLDVVAAQAAPGLVGVDQINVILPGILKAGQFKLRITANSVASNWVRFDLGARDQTLALANRSCLGGVQIVRMAGDPPAQFSGTVSLAYPAPPGGLLVNLQSGDEGVAIPGSVAIDAGQNSAGFQMAIAASRPSKPIKVTAALNGDVRTAVFEDGTPCVNGVALSTPGVVGGMSVNGSVQLTDAAPDGGVAVNLLSDNPSVQASSPVRVQAGRMSAGFTVDTSKGVVPSAATISAVGACGGSSASLSVEVAPCVTSVTFSSAAIKGGAGATGTVNLNSAALTGGLVVLLKSNDPAVQVPAQVTIPAGQSSAAFTLTSIPVMARTQAVIMASVGDCGASAGIIVNP